MKYKVIGFAALILSVAVVLGGSSVFPENDNERYIQHLEEPAYTACANCSGSGLCTHLPIININTGGVEIPGKTYRNEETKSTAYTLAADGSDTIAATAEIIDGEGNHHLSDEASLSSDIRIRIRGNSSRHFDKKPYLVELINPDGTNNDQEIMGMAAHHEWALHGPYLDKTQIRNYMWYNIAGQIMDYAPNVRFCELVINGEYQGLYLMTETITAGKEGARLTLSTTEKQNTFSGYILRHDRGSDSELKNIQPLSIYALRTDKKINIVYPGAANLNEELARGIELEFSAFEKAIHSYDFDDEEGYKGSIDVGSFVDYFIINEVSLNRDAGLYSTYIYKDISRKYKMCVWDFNNSLDNYEETANSTSGFAMFGTLWFNRIIQDQDFTEAIIRRYRELRKTVLSDEYLETFMDETIEWLGPAIDRNFEKWGYSFEESSDRLTPHNRNPRSYTEAVEQMHSCLKKRLAWMDENIESLSQYSAASKTHESHEAHEQ